jgi:glycosyltransferase involved in cell wall biosynthesis
MKNALEAQEFKNIFVMPNCKNIDILKTEDLIYASETPLKVCTFSRVIKEKGIEDAIAAVHSANEKIGKTAYHLDIYGEVGELQYEWFRSIENNFGTRIVYKGFVEPNTSVAVLKNYFALLFPTYYEGEGFAGTIIDAFASGVPVVASDWKYNCEIIREGHDGTVFPARDVCALTDKLVEIYENIDAWNAMKPNCLDRATEYLSENVIQVLTERL